MQKVHEKIENLKMNKEKVEDFLNKAKKVKVAATQIEFEKVAGKWMLKEKGAFEN